MTSITKASFPFRIGDNYAFHKVDYAYNFSTILRVVNLNTYLFLAVDQQFNLHFIQYRDPFPHEKPIVPPSFALKGTGRIKFSLEYHTLKAFLYGTRVEDANFYQYFVDRRESKEETRLSWSDVFYLGDDRLLIKPSSEEAAIVMYYDHRLESEKLIKIDWLSTTNIVPVDSSRVILYERGDESAYLTCTISQKTKTLKFSHSGGITKMKVITKHGVSLAVAVSEDIIQILDIIKNKVIDKICLFGSRSAAVIVDEVERSGSFITYYTKDAGRELNIKVNLTFWRLLSDGTVRNSQEIRFYCGVEPNQIVFLNSDHIVILAVDNALGIYRLDETGLISVHQTTLKLDPGYVSEINPHKAEITYHYSCLKVLDETTCLAVRARENDVSTDKQRLVILNYFFDSDKDSEGEDTEFPGLKRFQGITSKVLMDHYPDKAIGITHWEDKFVVFLTRSRKLYHYDLQTRKLELILTLQGIEENEASFVDLEVLDSDHVVVLFRRQRELDQFVVFDIKEKIPCVNSHEWFFGRSQSRMKCTVSFGKIFLLYAESSNNNIPSLQFREFDFVEKYPKLISNYPGRLLLSNLTVTPKLIAIGTLRPVPGGERPASEKIIFYSFQEKKTLYELNLDEIVPDLEAGNKMIQIMYVKYNLIALLFENSSKDSFIVFWDIDKRSAVAENRNYRVKRLLGVHQKLLLYHATFEAGVTGYLDFSSCFEKNSTKDKPNVIEEKFFYPFDPAFSCLDTLTPKLPVFVAYDKRMYPNSLLFLRKRNLKIECLRFVHRELNQTYNPYITRQIMDMIFTPPDENISEESKKESETGND